MMNKEELERLVFTNPLGLLALRSKEEINLADSYLPYSTGFEIECDQNKEVYSPEIFTNIPNIVEVKSDSTEQRYRVPNGINGLICLYHISNEAKRSLYLNNGPNGSGIHYHVDCTDCWTPDFGQELLKQTEQILEKLSEWKNKGTYNNKGISINILTYSSGSGSWARTNSLRTLEFRIGQMTFEYTDWVKCIIQINQMVKKIKDAIQIPQPVYKDVDTRLIMKYNNQILRGKANKSREDFLKEKLAKLTVPLALPQANPDLNAMRELIRNRIQNL